jgi:hypothetical protein
MPYQKINTFPAPGHVASRPQRKGFARALRFCPGGIHLPGTAVLGVTNRREPRWREVWPSTHLPFGGCDGLRDDQHMARPQRP